MGIKCIRSVLGMCHWLVLIPTKNTFGMEKMTVYSNTFYCTLHHPTALSLQSYPSPGHLNIRLFGNNSAAAACLHCF